MAIGTLWRFRCNSTNNNNISRLCCNYFQRSSSTNTKLSSTDKLLNALNTSPPEILAQFCLSPLTIINLYTEKDIVGEFKSLSELQSAGLFREKLTVLKKIILNEEQSVEDLQSIIASGSSTNLYESNLQNIINDINLGYSAFKTLRSLPNIRKKKNLTHKTDNEFTSPSLDIYDFQKFNVITAVSLSASHIGLTTLDIKRRVLDISSVPLIPQLSTDSSKFQYPELHELYVKVSAAVKKFSESDLYILERMTGSRVSEDPMFTQIKAMLFPLLDKRKNFMNTSSIVFLKNVVLTKLYNLGVGGERKSCTDIGESILAGRCNLPWIPSLSFSPVALQKYILSTRFERVQMIESLLLGLAFYALIIKGDTENAVIS